MGGSRRELGQFETQLELAHEIWRSFVQILGIVHRIAGLGGSGRC